MPTYTYKREDGTFFEIDQKITEDALTTCPTTGQPVKRVITGGAGLVFKGSGFYLTDYAKSGSKNGGESSSKEKADSSSDSDSGSSSDSSSSDSSSSKETTKASSSED